MKRLYSVVFLLLIVLNTVGYYGLLWIAQRQQTADVLEKIAAYSDEISGSLILTIPVALPYSVDSDEYERLDGTIVYGGEIYRLVKQKQHHNIRYVVCIRDNPGSKVRGAMDEFSQVISGQETGNHQSGLKVTSSPAKYFMSVVLDAECNHSGWCRISNYPEFGQRYSFSRSFSIFHPPKQA